MRSRSGSASGSDLSADNIEIFVSINDSKSIKLNVRPIHTVANVLEFLSASTTLPTDVKLLVDGKPLDPSTTVGELNLNNSAALQLSPQVRGASPDSANMTATLATPSENKSDESKAPASQPLGTATTTGTTSSPARTGTSAVKRPNRPRCLKEGCKAPAQPIVGDCGFCQKRFCGKHRMLESHACTGLDDARQADKNRNAAKLEGERTVMLRGL